MHWYHDGAMITIELLRDIYHSNGERAYWYQPNTYTDVEVHGDKVNTVQDLIEQTEIELSDEVGHKVKFKEDFKFSHVQIVEPLEFSPKKFDVFELYKL